MKFAKKIRLKRDPTLNRIRIGQVLGFEHPQSFQIYLRERKHLTFSTKMRNNRIHPESGLTENHQRFPNISEVIAESKFSFKVQT